MATALKADPDFTACQVSGGDESFANGIFELFEFNITRLLSYLEESPEAVMLVEVSVDDFHREFSKIDETHVDSVDTSRPVVLAEMAPGRYNLIDGNHRMEKARRLGIRTTSAYRLSPEQHTQFLTCKRAYESYVEYWNGKLG